MAQPGLPAFCVQHISTADEPYPAFEMQGSLLQSAADAVFTVYQTQNGVSVPLADGCHLPNGTHQQASPALRQAGSIKAELSSLHAKLSLKLQELCLPEVWLSMQTVGWPQLTHLKL
jgi:hypothetical protein